MNRGFALITVLAITIMLALSMAAVLQAMGSHADMKSANLQEVRAQFLAEAAMQEAIWRCKNGGCVQGTYQIDTRALDGTSTTENVDVTIDSTLGGGMTEIQICTDYRKSTGDACDCNDTMGLGDCA